MVSPRNGWRLDGRTGGTADVSKVVREVTRETAVVAPEWTPQGTVTALDYQLLLLPPPHYSWTQCDRLTLSFLRGWRPEAASYLQVAGTWHRLMIWVPSNTEDGYCRGELSMSTSKQYSSQIEKEREFLNGGNHLGSCMCETVSENTVSIHVSYNSLLFYILKSSSTPYSLVKYFQRKQS